MLIVHPYCSTVEQHEVLLLPSLFLGGLIGEIVEPVLWNIFGRGGGGGVGDRYSAKS